MSNLHLWKNPVQQRSSLSVGMPPVRLSLRLMALRARPLLFVEIEDQIDPTSRQRLTRNVVGVDVERLAETLQYRVMN